MSVTLQYGTKVVIRVDISCVNSCRSCDLIYGKGLFPSVGKTGQEPCERVRASTFLLLIYGGVWIPMQVFIGQGNARCSLPNPILFRYVMNIEGRYYPTEYQRENNPGSVLIMCTELGLFSHWYSVA